MNCRTFLHQPQICAIRFAMLNSHTCGQDKENLTYADLGLTPKKLKLSCVMCIIYSCQKDKEAEEGSGGHGESGVRDEYHDQFSIRA